MREITPVIDIAYVIYIIYDLKIYIMKKKKTYRRPITQIIDITPIYDFTTSQFASALNQFKTDIEGAGSHEKVKEIYMHRKRLDEKNYPAEFNNIPLDILKSIISDNINKERAALLAAWQTYDTEKIKAIIKPYGIIDDDMYSPENMYIVQKTLFM